MDDYVTHTCVNWSPGYWSVTVTLALGLSHSECHVSRVIRYMLRVMVS